LSGCTPFGRWTGTTWDTTTDASDSPLLDAGDAAASDNMELRSNIIDIGNYGNTVEASFAN
jgi:hypothetical protein